MAGHLVNTGDEPRDEVIQSRFRLRSLTQIRARQCRWPVLEDQKQIGHFLFCCLPTDGAAVYCTTHHKLAVSRATKGTPFRRMAKTRAEATHATRGCQGAISSKPSLRRKLMLKALRRCCLASIAMKARLKPFA
ncbi:hypothetical protein IHQ71_07960 [Rhizobium sp. TH2]|uniref:GcrA family cell cycle regulator n=1 Tax=Rhizobium sp. TH2 TaxID=2775403 RepID=UPI00220E01FB|nr:hypothetical protein IHQ71_07960 [Rhizobium sp. TH2]